jgi:predicted alpha/beta superfamily hydrolase
MLPPPMPMITFVVRVPPETKADARVYLAGSLAAVGRWKPDGVPLTRGDDGLYWARVRLPRGAVLLYKVTLGSWQTVEKTRAGRDVGNRKLRVEGDTTVELEVEGWAAGEPGPPRATLTGDIRYHHDFPSRHLGNRRTLVVYLPPDYAADRRKRYPVLYLHDGQNVFDAATAFGGVEWQADETAERLSRAGRITPPILVGVYNTADRVNEYTPFRDGKERAGGKGPLYARFLAEEVKPFIDGRYRTRPGREHTGVLGSSLGGLISLYIASQYPEQFGLCGAVSPSLWWGRERLLKDLEKEVEWMKNVRFWVDMGTREGDEPGDAIPATRRLVARFDAAGLVPGRDYYYQEVFDGEHNEASWAARFDKILLYFFGK